MNSKRMKATGQMVILEELFVTDGEQRPPQCGKHRQLIVGPFNRHQRGAKRLDLFAIVEGLAADEQMSNATRFERIDVRARDVLPVADKPPKEDTDVAWLERHSCRLPPLRDRPTAVANEPMNVGADRVWQRGLDLPSRHETLSIGLWNRQRHDRWLRHIVMA